MAERKNSEAVPSRHSHAISAPSFRRETTYHPMGALLSEGSYTNEKKGHFADMVE